MSPQQRALRARVQRVLLEALEEIHGNPCDALAWSQARLAAHQLGAQLVVEAQDGDGVDCAWDVADVDWDETHRMPMLLLVTGNGMGNAYLNATMRAHVRWEG